MKKYKISRLNKRAEFGTVKSVTGSDLVRRPTFVSQFSLWYGSYNDTATLAYSKIGTDYQDSKTIVIRHNEAVSEPLLVMIDNVQYSIIQLQSDDDGVNTFDLVTIQLVKK